MKPKSTSSSLVLLYFALIVGCTHDNSPTDSQNKTNLITRAWTGETFFTVTVADTARRFKDVVLLLEFKTDGTYFLSKISDSNPGKQGNWNLEEEGAKIKMSLDPAHPDVFSIVELNSARFVIGDTNSYGYSLVPKVN